MVRSGWFDLDPDVRAKLESVLTVKQLDVVKLRLGGMSIAEIALALDVARPVIKEHLEAAERNARKKAQVQLPL